MKLLLLENASPLWEQMRPFFKERGILFTRDPAECDAVLWFAQGEKDFALRAEKLCGELCDQSVLILLPYALWESEDPQKRAEAAAVCGAAGALSRKLAPSGIRVNCLRYGAVTGEPLADWVALQRTARPEEIARAVLFFLGEGTSFMTGQIIDVNGGRVH